MQWMFMLIGLVLGGLLDESFSGALLGALLGLVIGQMLRIARLGSQAAEQQRQLEQVREALQGVAQRLAGFAGDGGNRFEFGRQFPDQLRGRGCLLSHVDGCGDWLGFR